MAYSTESRVTMRRARVAYMAVYRRASIRTAAVDNLALNWTSMRAADTASLAEPRASVGAADSGLLNI